MKPTGLYYFKDIISENEEKEIINYLNRENEWFNVVPNTKSREVIHYGYEYPYRFDKNSKMNKIKDIPEIFNNVLKKIYNMPELKTLFENYKFDQLIINKYEPGQGIAPHVDHIKFFDKIIACFTIGSGLNIKFNRVSDGKEYDIYVEPRSFYIMSENARYNWTHGINKQITDVYSNKVIPRETRISLTFRKVNNP